MDGMLVSVMAVAILYLIPAWRIFGKAGLEPALALVVLIPYVGPLIVMAILASADWPRNREAHDGEQGGI